jgi:hypothetical protein
MIFSGHDNGKVIRFEKEENYMSDLFIETGSLYSIKVS